MTAFLLRRFLALIPLLLGVSLLVFILMSIAPGDFLTPIKSQRDIPPEYIQQLEKEYGLDRPWPVQYALWLKNALTGNFGYSWTYKVPVFELLGQRLSATLLLNLTSLAFAWLIAVPLGVLAAMYKDSLFDRLSALLAYAALSFPEFFLAVIALYFAAQTGWLPIGGLTSIDHDFLPPAQQALDVALHLILPTFVLGIGSVAGLMRVMRANFLDYIRAEFVTTARAKGLPEGLVMFRHVFRNAINPLITSLGFALSSLLSGALLIEIIFQYPGIGQLTYQSLLREDQFVVMASVLVGCLLLVLGNLLADLLLAAADPRVRLEKSQ